MKVINPTRFRLSQLFAKQATYFSKTLVTKSGRVVLSGTVFLVSVFFLISSTEKTANNGQATNVLKNIYNLSEFPDPSQTPQTYSRDGIVEHVGLKGKFTTLFDKDRGYYSSVDLGLLGFRQGFDGAKGWEANPNGIVNDISRLNEDLLVIVRIVESKEYLSVSERTLDRECLGPKTFQGRGGYLFQFTTDKGITAEVFIDSLTGNVMKVLMVYDFVEAEIIYSDFREIDGFTFAFRSELTANISDLNITMQTQSSAVNEPITDSSFLRPETNNTAVTFPVGIDSLMLPLEYFEGHLYLRMNINGSKSRLFLLDSGAGSLVIDAVHIEALGIKNFGSQSGLGVAGSVEFSFATIDEMNLGGIIFNNQIVSVLSLGEEMRSALRGIVGIVGYDFLARFIVTVDYGREQMTIYPPSRKIVSGANDIIATMPIYYYLNVPTVVAKVNSRVGTFLIDIGSGYSALLHEGFVMANSLEDLPKLIVPNDKGYIGGVGGFLPTQAVTIENFELPNLQIKNQAAWTILGGKGVSASKVIAGNIGNGFLENYRVTFDYPHQQIILHDITQLPTENLLNSTIE